jgi:DNA-binding HxlR family transcriptional regulator
VGTKREPFDAMRVDCPSRVVLDRIGDRWTVFVISALGDGPLRFTRLKERVGRITAKVLTETLRSLEADGLIIREAFAESPPRVEYRLTPLGESLLTPITEVRRWAETHVEQVLQSRDRADQRILAAR